MDVRSWTLGDDLRPEDNLLDDITFPEQIPDDIIFEHYDGVCFVPDDFCCTAGQDY